MREYVLMTDSCCDLPDQMARELQLEVLPLTMHMEGQDYPNTLDGAAISNEEFYRRIRAGKMATTSAVNVGQFEDAMSAVLAGGRDILCICFSSALSTTYQSACIAAEDLLGLHLRGGVLYPEPHLPAGWPECTARWRDGAGLLHTIRLRPDGVTVDGEAYDGGGIGKKRPKPYSQDR